MSRRIWLSLLTLLIAFCIGLSVIAFGGAVLLVYQNQALPVQATPTPQSSLYLPGLI